MDRLQLPRALKALIAMSKTPYDTPASTCALQNKTRKGLEGECLRAENLPICHLTLEEYDKVCRDISTGISRYIAATPCQIIPTQREHRILIAKGLIAKARIQKSQIIKGLIIKVQIK